MEESRLYFAIPQHRLEETLIAGANDSNGVVLMTDESMAGVYCYRRYGATRGICVFAVDRRALSVDDDNLSDLITTSFFIRVSETHIPPVLLELLDCYDLTAEEIRKYPDDIW